MRISDWSSDVCSSDLLEPIPVVDADEPETTEEEIEGFNIIRAILREDVDVRRIVMRDAKTYCAVLLDDNNRKPIARLHFNGQSKKYVGLFSAKAEERVEVGTLEDIFSLASRLRATLAEYK